jgi:hypothetical protein
MLQQHLELLLGSLTKASTTTLRVTDLPPKEFSYFSVVTLLATEPEVQALALQMKTFQLQVLMARMFTHVAL